MKALVLGRSGQVATELARLLPEATVLGRDAADLSDPAAATAAVRDAPEDCRVVINAAAWTAVDRAEQEEDAARALNATAPGALAAACAARGLPFLHVSTDYVFDGTGTAPFAPDAPTAPLGAYGRTKLEGEQAVRAAMEGTGTPWAVLRTSWVFSAHGANFVKTMLRLGAERDRLTVVEDQVGGPTPAADIAATLVAMAGVLVRDGGPSGIYHLSGGPDTSWAGFAAEIMARAGLDCEIAGIPSADYPTPAARPANSRLDMAITTRDFGVARPDWREGLDAVLAELGATAG